MSQAKRIIGITFIFGCMSVAWMILGGVMSSRTTGQSDGLQGNVADLWGSSQQQTAPTLTFLWDTWENHERTEIVDGKLTVVRTRDRVHHTKPVFPSKSDVAVDLKLDQRLKGLIWYALYDVAFGGTWKYEHREEIAGELQVNFAFPETQGLFDDFRFVVDGHDRARDSQPEQGQLTAVVPVAPRQTIDVVASYKSRGMDTWRYSPGSGVASLENFALKMTTDFSDIDFPPFTMSPSEKRTTENGWALTWDFKRVVTGHGIGMVMPTRIQPGQMASSLSFSAPISLLFFFLIIFVLATLRGIDIHPINYFFLGTAFFAFHLFFGYSVDHLHLIPAFVIASIISIVLVTTYLRLVVSNRFAFVEAALAQLIYLVGFSLAYFWEGYTGLTVTVLSIVTLFVLMQLTGRLSWTEVLSRTGTRSRALPEAARVG
jgi:inner membrane protein involved in colicin E2 resistance